MCLPKGRWRNSGIFFKYPSHGFGVLISGLLRNILKVELCRNQQLLNLFDSILMNIFKNSAAPTLTTNHGTYRGYDEIFRWYVEDFEKSALRNDCAMQARHEILQQFHVDELHGVGTFLVDTFTTPIIELAEDMATAKGWFCGSAITTDIVDGMPQARWTWKKYGVDFVLEDGAYKIWHLKMLTEFSMKPGGSWTDGSDELPCGAPPSDLACQYEFYSPERVPENNPPIPVPYRTFRETFSY